MNDPPSVEMTRDDGSRLKQYRALEYAYESSLVVTRCGQARRILERSWPSSRSRRLAFALNWLSVATRDSFLYRWFTKEPQPNVIVIDLRETYTLGPVIAILNPLVTRFAEGWRTSWLKRATDGLVPIVEVATRSWTGRTTAKLLEPPEPPDSRDDE